MKKIILLCVLEIVITRGAYSFPVVETGPLTEKTLAEFITNVDRWEKQARQLQAQIDKATEIKDLTSEIKKFAGDPSSIQDVKASNLSNKSEGELLPKIVEDINKAREGIGGVQASISTYDGGGIYKKVGELPEAKEGMIEGFIGDLKGTLTGENKTDVFKPYAAMEEAVENYKNVITKNRDKMEKIRDEIKKKSDQLRTANTEAKIQKLTGAIIALHTEISVLMDENQLAALQVKVLDMGNRNDVEKKALIASMKEQVKNADRQNDLINWGLDGAQKWVSMFGGL